ncbi:MAG: acyl-ACP thioesterase domain-containing protein [Bacteroidota bacterium]
MSIYSKYTYTESCIVGTYEIDAQKRMRIPALVRRMQEAAMQNVLEMKVSLWDLEVHQLSWVLMRLRVDIHRLPRLGEPLRIITYPSGFERLFTYRDYKVVDENNQLIASAPSTWLLMDTAKRRMARIPDFILAKEMPDESRCLPRVRNPLPEFKDSHFSNSFQVHWHDLDFNEHLNNVIYIQKMIDTVPAVLLQEASPSQFDILYRAEARWKDELLSEVQEVDEQTLLHRLRRPSDNKVLALARSRWKREE